MKVLISSLFAALIAFSGAANAFHVSGHSSGVLAGSYSETDGGTAVISAGAFGFGGGAQSYVQSGAYNESGAYSDSSSHSPSVDIYTYSEGGSYGETETSTYGLGAGISGSISTYGGFGTGAGAAFHN